MLGGRFGSFIGGWAEFDSQAFSIGKPEAATMDPQQRTLLEVCNSGFLSVMHTCNGK